MSTLKSIAEQAGVSVAAASVALGGRPSTIGVSKETRERIRRVARASGYRPNPLAASLRTGRTRTIGVYLPNSERYLAHPQGARNFWTICDAAAQRGYHVSIIMPTDQQMDARLMDGCLIMDNVEPGFEDRMTDLAGVLPVVSMTPSVAGAITVQQDRSWHTWRRRAAEYLYQLGHRRVAVVHVKEQDPSSQSRIPAQFEEAANAAGIQVSVQAFAETSLDRAYPTIDRILAAQPQPTAVFATDDDYARALIARLLHAGIRVPRDVSVFSGSTSPTPDCMLPALTGLVLKYDEQLRFMCNRFVEILEDDGKESEIVLPPVEVELMERQSCGPAPGRESGDR